MVDVASKILDKLKCEICDNHLSCSPVYLKTDGSSICGRCPAPKEEATRNKPYEDLASMIIFPCRYQDKGCPKKHLFKDLTKHEESCSFRQFICPVVPSGSCDWIGSRDKLLEHCQLLHPKQILEHPIILQHDITKNSLNSYLLMVYQTLFLLQTKVCLLSRKIYHSVRLIGDPERSSMFEYQLDIENSGGLLKKKKGVAPEGCLALQEDSSLASNINSLLEFLGGFEGTSFKITVNKLFEDCVKCGKYVKELYSSAEGSLCIDCSPTMLPCPSKERGCGYKDIQCKIAKHDLHYCKYKKCCYICKKNLNTNLEEHYMEEHSDIMDDINSKWRLTPTDFWQWRIIKSDVGLLCFSYRLRVTEFIFGLRTPLRSNAINNFSCELRLTQPTSGKTLTCTMDVAYEWMDDYRMTGEPYNLKALLSDGKCDVKLNIFKKVSI